MRRKLASVNLLADCLDLHDITGKLESTLQLIYEGSLKYHAVS